MKCPKCGADNSDAYIFCVNCGARLEQEAETGAENTYGTADTNQPYGTDNNKPYGQDAYSSQPYGAEQSTGTDQPYGSQQSNNQPYGQNAYSNQPYGNQPYGSQQSTGTDKPHDAEQSAYGNQPYGANSDQPYGQSTNSSQPYGQSASGNQSYGSQPYGTQQDTYGDQTYGTQQNPYGSQPYGTQQGTYGDRTYGTQQNPYGDRPFDSQQYSSQSYNSTSPYAKFSGGSTAPAAKEGHSTMAVVAFICSLLCLWPIGLVLGIIDLVKNKDKKHGFSIAAVIISGLYLIFFILICIITGVAVKEVADEAGSGTYSDSTFIPDTEDASEDRGITDESEDESTEEASEEASEDATDTTAGGSSADMFTTTVSAPPLEFLMSEDVVSEVDSGNYYFYDGDKYVYVNLVHYETELTEDDFRSFAMEALYTGVLMEESITEYAAPEETTCDGHAAYEYTVIINQYDTEIYTDALTIYVNDYGLVTLMATDLSGIRDEDYFDELVSSVKVDGTYDWSGVESSDSSDTASDVDTSDATTGEANALSSAKSYLDFMAFSKEGLIDQLEYEGYSTEEATYAVENCGADWNEQAVKAAENYLDFMAFSESGLQEQLEYDGFTTEEAQYGVENCGADWMEQAVKSAESYLDFMAMSESELKEQLEFDGFTAEEAAYGASEALK